MTNDELYKHIMNMTNVKDATLYINTSNITKSDLGKLCKKFNIFIEDKPNKEELINRFVTSTLGVKLRKKVINKYNNR